jgi:hypothetical protein
MLWRAALDGVIAEAGCLTLTKPCLADNRVMPDYAAANLESNRIGKLDSVHVVAFDHGIYDAEVPVPCGFLTNPYTCTHSRSE